MTQTTEATQEARLMNIVRHYTGSDDVKALMETPEWKSASSKYNGDVELIINSLAIKRNRNTTIKGWFLADKSGESRKGEKYAFSRVLFPDLEVRSVGEPLGLAFLAPVTIQGAEEIRNIATGQTSIKTHKDVTSVVAGGHNDPVPDVPITKALQEARSLKTWGDLKGKVRNNKADDIFFNGKVPDDERAVFIQTPEGDRPGRVSIDIVDAHRNPVSASFGEPTFRRQFGFDPFEDPDTTKAALVGRKILGIFGSVETTAKLPEEKENDLREELVLVAQKHTRKNPKTKKTELAQRVDVGGLVIESLYHDKRKGGIVFKVDVDALGYKPSVSCEPRNGVTGSGTEDDPERAWSAGDGYTIQFEGADPARPPVRAEFKGLGDLLQRKLEA